MAKHKDKISPNRNYSAFWALMKKMPYADKDEIVDRWTGGRTQSLKEMTDNEYRLMINGLNKVVNDQEKLRRARSVALRQIQLYGINTSIWGDVNRFVSQPRIAGKIFVKLSIPELVALTRKMRAINESRSRKAVSRRLIMGYPIIAEA